MTANEVLERLRRAAEEELPYNPEAWAPITVRQLPALLAHIEGLEADLRRAKERFESCPDCDECFQEGGGFATRSSD